MASSTLTQHLLQTNLSLLGFTFASSHGKVHDVTGQMIQTCWFLFHQLDASQAKQRFAKCYPVIDHKVQGRDFKHQVFKWLEELKKEGNLAADIQIRKSYFDECRGERYDRALLALSVLVLQTQLKRSQCDYSDISDLHKKGNRDQSLSEYRRDLRVCLEKEMDLFQQQVQKRNYEVEGLKSMIDQVEQHHTSHKERQEKLWNFDPPANAIKSIQQLDSDKAEKAWLEFRQNSAKFSLSWARALFEHHVSKKDAIAIQYASLCEDQQSILFRNWLYALLHYNKVYNGGEQENVLPLIQQIALFQSNQPTKEILMDKSKLQEMSRLSESTTLLMDQLRSSYGEDKNLPTRSSPVVVNQLPEKFRLLFSAPPLDLPDIDFGLKSFEPASNAPSSAFQYSSQSEHTPVAISRIHSSARTESFKAQKLLETPVCIKTEPPPQSSTTKRSGPMFEAKKTLSPVVNKIRSVFSPRRSPQERPVMTELRLNQQKETTPNVNESSGNVLSHLKNRLDSIKARQTHSLLRKAVVTSAKKKQKATSPKQIVLDEIADFILDENRDPCSNGADKANWQSIDDPLCALGMKPEHKLHNGALLSNGFSDVQGDTKASQHSIMSDSPTPDVRRRLSYGLSSAGSSQNDMSMFVLDSVPESENATMLLDLSGQSFLVE